MLALSVLIVCSVGPPTDHHSALRLLQGEWNLVSKEVDGKQLVGELGSVMKRCVVKGAVVTLLYRPLTETIRFDFTLVSVPHQPRKSVDLVWRDGSKCRAIYALDGDDLFLAVNRSAGGDRPNTFNSLSGKTIDIYVFRKKRN